MLQLILEYFGLTTSPIRFTNYKKTLILTLMSMKVAMEVLTIHNDNVQFQLAVVAKID